MLTHDLGHRSASAECFPANTEQKRKRRIFSCSECRRKKLRCDRVYPSCGRCQESSHATSCVYDSNPFSSEYAVLSSSSSIKGKENLNQGSKYTSFRQPIVDGGQYQLYFQEDDVPLSVPVSETDEIASKLERLTSLRNSVGDGGQYGGPLVNDLITLLKRQMARITVLENEIGQLESKHSLSNQNQQWYPSSTPISRSIIHNISSSFNEPPSSPTCTNSPDKEDLLFRGKGFNTRYYGASNPMSVVWKSPAIIKNVSMLSSS